MAEYITWRGKTTTTKNKAMTSGNRLGSVEALEASAAGTKPVASHHLFLPGIIERRRKSKRSMVVMARAKREGHRQAVRPETPHYTHPLL